MTLYDKLVKLVEVGCVKHYPETRTFLVSHNGVRLRIELPLGRTAIMTFVDTKGELTHLNSFLAEVENDTIFALVKEKFYSPINTMHRELDKALGLD